MNNTNSLFWSKVKNKLANEGLHPVILALKVAIPSTSIYYDNIILIEREYIDINTDYSKGIINEEYKRLVYNRMNDKMLFVINQLAQSTINVNQLEPNLSNLEQVTKQVRIANFINDVEKGIIRGYLNNNSQIVILNKHITVNSHNNFINIIITREFRKQHEGSYWKVKSLKNEFQWHIQIDIAKIGTVNIIENGSNLLDLYNENMVTILFSSRSSEKGIKTRSEQLEINSSLLSFPGREYSKTEWTEKQVIEIQMSSHRIDKIKFLENISEIIKK